MLRLRLLDLANSNTTTNKKRERKKERPRTAIEYSNHEWFTWNNLHSIQTESMNLRTKSPNGYNHGSCSWLVAFGSIWLQLFANVNDIHRSIPGHFNSFPFFFCCCWKCVSVFCMQAIPSEVTSSTAKMKTRHITNFLIDNNT